MSKILNGYALKDKRGNIWFSTISEFKENVLSKKEWMEYSYENHAPFKLAEIEIKEKENENNSNRTSKNSNSKSKKVK